MNTAKFVLLLGACVAFLGAAPAALAESKGHDRKAKHGAKPDPDQKGSDDGPAKSAKPQAAASKADAHKAKAEAHRKEKQGKKAAATQKKAVAHETAQKARGEARVKKAKADSARTGQTNAVTENRQTHQEKRIDQGIKKGYLTPDEIGKLKTQQKNIESLQQQFNGDGKITRAESKQLRDSLNNASLDIWTEKHNTDGRQMPVYRLGKDVRLNPDVAARLAADNLSKADARAFLGDFHSLVQTKQKLNGSLPDSERAQLQAQYNEKLGVYFSTEPTRVKN